MHQKLLSVLEFNKIKALLKEHAVSILGEAHINRLVPSTNFEEVKKWQDETEEAANVLRLKGNVPITALYDIKAHLKRAEIGGILSAKELVEIASMIRTSRTMKRFIEELVETRIELPILLEKSNQIAILAPLLQELNIAINEDGQILDSASQELRQLRQRLRTTESRIREKLDSLTRSKNAAKMLSDSIITIRNDRYVIPVKQEYRSNYGGIVHDQSASGQTLFIEPQAVVTLNNDLRNIQLHIQQEINRILQQLSVAVAEHVHELFVITRIMGDFDFVFAKARYGKSIKASKPLMNHEGRISLIKARHPLLPIEQAVANDIYIGDEFTSMVITGPNTGGKTITLKTVGLSVLMAQAGLQVPAAEDSEVAVFDKVFADIGDEQSIEQSLSTFSSHMVNIVEILKTVDDKSLVLFDELGAGTDPQEGAALAISILDEVYHRGARVIATTHYPELKAYGYNRDGVKNASVEFDVETLSPTFRLLIGVPGRSNAFEISKRLGLPTYIIQEAKEHVSLETNKVDKMISSLEESRKEADKAYEDAKAYLENAEKLHKELEAETKLYEDKKEALMNKAAAEASQLVDKAKEEAETIIKELRTLRLNHGAEVKEHELIEAKTRLTKAAPTTVNEKTKAQQKNQSFEIGDEVKVISFNQIGQLLEKTGNKEWNVQLGALKMKVKEKNMERIGKPKVVETRPMATVRSNAHVKTELDLRGERYEDALLKVEKYLDDALLAGYGQVSIIHGKGTGALRKGVQDFLKQYRAVKRIRFGEAAEGGSGVTIVEFK